MTKNAMPGRNEPCLCGSGKKFKKCCLGGVIPVGEGDRLDSQKRAGQYMLAGDMENAETAFIYALKKNGRSIECLVGLGQCLYRQWKVKEGRRYLLKAAKILLFDAQKTRDVKSVLDLLFLMITLHESKEVVPLASEVLIISPDLPRAHHVKALALQRINSQRALVSAKRAVELAPNESNAVILLATLESKEGEVLRARARLKELTEKEGVADLPRVYLELGKVLDKLGEYGQAFDCFTKAGELNLQKAELQKIDLSSVSNELKRSRQFFDKSFFQCCQGKVDDSGVAPVFLLGFYRSGTTLMEQILAAHSSIVTSNEAYIMPALANEIFNISSVSGSLQEKTRGLTERQLIHLRKFYWQTAEQMLGRKLSGKVFVDKTTMNTLNLGVINTIFPDAMVLFAIRDPRDVCVSCFMQSFELSPLTVHFLGWESTASFYIQIMDYWLSVREGLTVQWIELRYEDVVSDMQRVFEPVFERLGLQWSAECDKFYLHAQKNVVNTPSFDQVVKPLYRTSVQRWRNYESRFSGVMEALNVFIEKFDY